MPSAVAFVRFWPESMEWGRRRTQASDGWVALAGAFDVACLLEAQSVPEAASGLLASLAGVERPSRAAPPEDPFVALPPGTGVQLHRAAGGWLLTSLPDQMAWLTLAMAFLRRRVYQRATFTTAWHSAAVNELGALVFATHQADDAEGTCRTYGVPALALSQWTTSEPSDRVAKLVQYAALLPVGTEFTILAARDGLAQALRRSLSPEFLAETLIGQTPPVTAD